MTESKPQRFTKFDLAALSFHMRDVINREAACLEGREMHADQVVQVTVTTTLVKTERGHLIFGNFSGLCSND